MKVFLGFDSLPAFRNPVVTMGSYDGVHAGHRILLGRIMDLARRREGESVVITFSPHPRFVLEGENCHLKLLNTLREKTMLLEEVGVDNLIVVPFTPEFSRISSHDFVKDYLIGKVGVATLVVGYNHHFGHNKEGDFGYLERLRDEFGFDIFMIPKQEVDNDKVSSTLIRGFITNGEVAKAASYLGYRYFALARAAGQDGSGLRLYPDEECKLLPPAGRYTVEAEYGGGSRRTVLEIGGEGGLRLTGPSLPQPDGFIKIIFC